MCQRRQKSWIETAAYGRVEVVREPEPEQEREADRDVGVAGEVGVDLHRIGVERDEHLERRVLAGGAEDPVDDAEARWFAITTFLNRPVAIRKNARAVST